MPRPVPVARRGEEAGMDGRTEARQDKKELAEEYCFTCKDTGGGLRVCDFENCFKSYHPSCAGDDDGFLSSDEQFICDWHNCVNCRGSSDYQCLCCPLYSLCNACLGHGEFVQLGKQNKGFCSTCLEQAILIEKNADPDVEKTDGRDEIARILFKDYWEKIRDRENLTLVDLEVANVLLNTRLNCKGGVNSENFPVDDNKSDENVLADNDANDQTINSESKQNKVNTSLKKKSNKKTFIGWGSEELMKFLSSLGKDTAKPLDEREIVGAVKGYIKEKNLYRDDKKHCFLCDDSLQPLFTRRKVRCKMIRKFLKVHLASNAVSEDEISYGSEDDDTPVVNKRPQNSPDDDTPVMKKRRQNSLEPKIAKRVSERSKRCFAALVHKNINLIYLKKTLVVNLLSHPDTFERKVVGCFVRVKVAHKVQSYLKSTTSFLLGRITGIKKASEEYKVNGRYTNILLCVTVPWVDVMISTLSDEDFEEDECSYFISSVKDGLLERVTIAEFEEKVATVHTDIVNHWMERELMRLERNIDRAHIKGLHAEMEQLLHQKQLLSTPAERQRRLEEVPKIEYEEKETELEVAASNSSQENRGKKRGRVCSVDVEENSKGAAQQVANSLNDLEDELPKGAAQQVANSLNDLEGKLPKGARDQVPESLNILDEESSKGGAHQVVDSLNVHNGEPNIERIEGVIEQIPDSLRLINNDSSEVASKQGDATEAPSEAREACLSGVTPDPAQDSQLHGTQDDTPAQAMDDGKEESDHSRQVVMPKFKEVQVINLDSDEDEDPPNVQRKAEGRAMHAPRAMNGGSHWHYIDPQGVARGPFTLVQLYFWKQNGFFTNDFRVWRTGQTAEEAILLTDAFRMHP